MPYPTSLDDLKTDWANTTPVEDTHPSEHNLAGSAIEALEAKVGIDGSAVTTSHDYKLGEVTGSDKAVGKTATQTLTNKTLTTPTISSFANANHDHTNSAGGGQLNASSVFSAGTVPLARGGLGASLSDPDADRIPFWDDSAGSVDWLTVGTGLSITGTTLSSSASTPTITVYEAMPVGGGTQSLSTVVANSNTTMTLGMVHIPAQITVNNLSIDISTVGTAGTLDLVVYSEDGQTKYIDVTTASISATGIVTTSVSAVVLSAGNYYFAVNPNGTADLQLRSVSISSTNLRNPSSQPVTAGTLTITAGTPPSTITNTAITVGAQVPLFRFDN